MKTKMKSMKGIEFPSLKMRGGVLPVTLSFCVIFSTLCVALIMVAYYHHLRYQDLHIEMELIRNARSGVQYILAEPTNLQDQGILGIDLFDEGKDSVLLSLKQWGLFQLASAKAFRRYRSFTSSAFIGNYLDDVGKVAMYLSDEFRPLSIAGDTHIEGDVFLPKAGIRTTYINRVGYSKEKLVYGKEKDSEQGLPDLDERVLNQLKKHFSYPGTDQGFKTYDRLPEDLTFHSFDDSTILIRKDNDFHLHDHLRGNIIVKSNQNIKIEKDAVLEDVIVIGKKIEFEEGFKGVVQAFASDSVILNENVELGFPSTLAVLTKGEGYIHIAKNSKLDGYLFLYSEEKSFLSKLVEVDEGVQIRGQVYIDGLFQHKGSISGNLICRKFLFQTSNSRYENHLFNARIDNSLIDEDYLGTNLWCNDVQKGIIKWVY